MATLMIVAKPLSDVKSEFLRDPNKACKVHEDGKAQSFPWVCCTIVC